MKKLLLTASVLISTLILILIPVFSDIANAQLETGLVAYYTFNESSGNSVYDYSGNGNNGNINGAAWIKGKHDYALHFDGEDDYVVVPDSNSLNLTDAFTFEAWIYPRSFGEIQGGIILDKNSAAYAFYLRNVTSDPEKIAITLGGNQYFSNNNSIVLDEWQHVAVTFDRSLSSNQIKFYVDGVEAGTATRTKTVPSNTQPLYVGNRGDLKRTFNGAIDEVRTYNRALSGGEIQSAYSEESKIYFSGRLVDKNNNPVQATISIGSATDSATSETNTSGNYILKLTSNMYDVTNTYDATYSISNFFIPGFWIKLPSLNVDSDLQNLLNDVTGYPSANKLSFTVNGNRVVQIYSQNKPRVILINGTTVGEASSMAELKGNTWFYDSVQKKIYVKIKDRLYPPTLHVSGSKILDEDGNEVILRGFRIGGYVDGFTDREPYAFKWVQENAMPLSQAHLDQIKRWGFNVISVTVMWTGTGGPTEPYQDQPQVYNEKGLERMIELIRMAKDAGLYVIVSVRVCYDPEYTASGNYPWFGWSTHDYVTLNQSDSSGQYGLDRFAKYLNWLTGRVQGEPNVVGVEPWHFPYHRQDPDSERVSKYFNDVAPTMLNAVRKHTNKIIFLSSPTLGHFNYSEHPGPYSDSNIVYTTGGYGYYVIANCENNTCPKWDYDVSKIIHPHPSAWEFREKYNVPIMSTEGPGLAQHPISSYGRPLRQDRLDLFEAVLKIMDDLNGWVVHQYVGPSDDWGVLESKNPNDPASEGRMVEILKKYAPPQSS